MVRPYVMGASKMLEGIELTPLDEGEVEMLSSAAGRYVHHMGANVSPGSVLIAALVGVTVPRAFEWLEKRRAEAEKEIPWGSTEIPPTAIQRVTPPPPVLEREADTVEAINAQVRNNNAP